MGRVRARVGDKRVLALVKAFLKAGILTEDSRMEDTDTGTPQGSILSPLLSNVALSVLDEHFTQGKYSEFPSVDGRLDARRCWSTAVEAAGQATRADSLGGSVPAVSGWRVQAARSSGLSAQGRNRSRAAPVGGLPPASAQACR